MVGTVTIERSQFSQAEHRAISRALCRTLDLPKHWLHGASLPCGLPDLDNLVTLTALLCLAPPDLVLIASSGELTYRARLGMLETVEHETPGRAVADALVRLGGVHG
jgi:hypothetical protein